MPSMKQRGRDLAKCKRYRDRGTREINKRRKIERHLRRNPDDKVAQYALKNLHPRQRRKGQGDG